MYPEYVIEKNVFSLDPEIKARWLADLRSGTIAQTYSRLRRTDGSMCCLGVLSSIAVEQGVAEMELREGTDYYRFRGTDARYGSEVCLTEEVCEWAGLTNDDGLSAYGRLPFVDRDDDNVYLDTLNDDGMPFSQIADLIECWY